MPTRKDEKTPCEKMPFKTVNLSSFRVALCVFSSFRGALIRFFVFSLGVLLSFRVASFRLFTWRLFVFSRGVFSRGVISSFCVALVSIFVISSFRVALFRLFVISSFRVALFRLFVISSFRVALFRLFVNSSFRFPMEAYRYPLILFHVINILRETS